MLGQAISIARSLSKRGIVGINRRNNDYIQPYNPRHLFPLVDDKLRTKQLAQKAGIAVPDLYGVIREQHEVATLPEILKPYSDFVIKPSSGSGGEGVIVVSSRSRNLYRQVNGIALSDDELGYHVSNILTGMFSLGGKPDKALIEYRVKFDPVFEAISFQGVPDIRIIIFQGVPVMSMVRLPTRMSDGKANLHQGAIGSGIDIASGKTLTAVWKTEIVSEHPDTGNPVVGVQVPGWRQLLELASRCYELTGLGYQGVDIVLDRERGPLILELNARPGLSIQLANRAGLLPRLRAVEQRISKLQDVSARVDFAQENF